MTAHTANTPEPEPGGPPDLRVTWLGHGTVVIETGGRRLVVDPLLRGRIGWLQRTGGVVPAMGPVDAVLITHVHADHLDLPSLRRLKGTPHIVVPRGAEPLVRSLELPVSEVDVGDAIDLVGVDIWVTPAVHEARRGRIRAPALGFLIGGPPGVYVAGDTAVFPAMADLAGRTGVAMVPVAGWGPRLGPGHMNPGQAAEALTLIRPRAAVPIHWGTLRPPVVLPGSRYLREPPWEFVQRAAQAAPEVAIAVLRPGESLTLSSDWEVRPAQEA